MKPALLLLHGTLNTPAIWDAVADGLRGQAEVRVPDLRPAATIAAMAEAGWQSVQGQEAARLVVAGFSMGGYAALEMLAQPRRRVDALALISTSAQAETKEGLAKREKTIAALERDFPATVEGLLKLASHPALQADPVRLQALRTMMLSIGAQTAVRHNRAIAMRADRRDLLPSLAMPVAVVSSRDDRLVAPEFSEEIARLVATHVEWVEGGGHMLPFEQPQALVSILARLVRG
jgi:pimeloyl-ACP methyl ester carboxylesterase